jgi:hypothetical protein
MHRAPGIRTTLATSHVVMTVDLPRYGKRDLTVSDLARFEDYTYPDPNSGCFIWGGPEHGDGARGTFTFGKRSDGSRIKVFAHRISWLISGKELAPGDVLCHKCDTPSCLNPDHLFAGTMADNQQDMARKGRGRKGSGRLPYGVIPNHERFSARITAGNAARYLGTFDTPEEAHEVALAAKAKFLATGEIPMPPPSQRSPKGTRKPRR